MPGTITERVDRLETMFASFLERTEDIVSEIRSMSARMLEIQQQDVFGRERADRQRQEDHERAERERRDFNKRLAELSDSVGTLIEDMVAPNARRIASAIFQEDPVLTIAQRVRRMLPGDRSQLAEIDLLVAGREHLMIVEAKRRLNAQKVSEFVERLEHLRPFFPEYANHKIVAVIASVTIDPSVLTFLNRQKVYGVAMGDETMELINLDQF